MDFVRVRLLPVIVLAVLIVLQYRLWVEPGGVLNLLRLKHQVAADEANNKTLKAGNAALRQEVLSLKQGGEAVEARARYDLGMIRRGETFYHENSAEQ